MLKDYLSLLYEALNNISAFYWNIMIVLLLGTGIFFTFITRFVQFRHLFISLRYAFSSKFNRIRPESRSLPGIAPFHALCTSVASRVGVGNMAGVAIAISHGGPGAVFWMWITGMIGMSTSYAESLLAQVYKRRCPNNTESEYVGGPAYYILHGIGCKWLSVLFSIFFIIVFGYSFQSIQSNTMSAALKSTFNFSPIFIAISIFLITLLCFYQGVRKISKIASYIVPVMALLYFGITLYIIFMNYDKFFPVMGIIVSSAFTAEAGIGGVTGGLFAALINGVKRGLFSNEAGMGSAPNVAASANPFPHHPSTQACVQMISVAIDTLVICTCTAFVIILSSVGLDPNLDGILITREAFVQQIGPFGRYFIVVCIFLFTFTSLLGNYSYVESNVKFLSSKTIFIHIVRITSALFIALGCLVKTQVVWSIGDFAMAILATVNIIAILILSPVVARISKSFDEEIPLKKDDVRFRAVDFDHIKGVDKSIWT